jgi:hypothetical protein
MTFLQIVQRLRQECGVPGDGPNTVLNQVRELKRLVDWASQAYIELQEEEAEWEWMRTSTTFNTTAGKNSYNPLTELNLTQFGHWRNYSFRIYLTSAGFGNQILLSQCDYNTFRDYYLYGIRQTTQARPTVITVAPDRSLFLGLVPNDVYTVSGEYYRTPQILDEDIDVPEIPSRWHMAIVYKAMIKYAMFESAPEVLAAATENYNKMLNRIRREQMPPITIGMPFV